MNSEIMPSPAASMVAAQNDQKSPVVRWEAHFSDQVPLVEDPQQFARKRWQDAISDAQHRQVDELEAQIPTLVDAVVKAFIAKRTDAGASAESLGAVLARWANRDTAWRYLCAAKWDSKAAAKRLEATLAWRLAFRPDLIRAADVEVESESGKMYLNGFDRLGRPVLLMRPRIQNTKPSPRQIEHLVFVLEAAIALMPAAGKQQLVLLIDFEGFSLSTAPSLSVSKEFLDIVGSHYPERLGAAFFVSPTWYFNAFFKLIGPFVDPVTRTKLWTVDLKTQHSLAPSSDAAVTTPVSPVASVASAGGHRRQASSDSSDNKHGLRRTCLWSHIPRPLLESNYGGHFEYQYDHAAYWPALLGAISYSDPVEERRR